jgi:hypothetical protein
MLLSQDSHIAFYGTDPGWTSLVAQYNQGITQPEMLCSVSNPVDVLQRTIHDVIISHLETRWLNISCVVKLIEFVELCNPDACNVGRTSHTSYELQPWCGSRHRWHQRYWYECSFFFVENMWWCIQLTEMFILCSTGSTKIEQWVVGIALGSFCEPLNLREERAEWFFCMAGGLTIHCRFHSVSPSSVRCVVYVMASEDYVQLELRTWFHCKFPLRFSLWKVGTQIIHGHELPMRELLGMPGTNCWYAPKWLVEWKFFSPDLYEKCLWRILWMLHGVQQVSIFHHAMQEN